MARRRLSAALAVTALATACLETHAPQEQGPIPPLEYSDVLVDAAGGSGPGVMLEGGTGVHVVYIAERFADFSPLPLAYAGCAGGCEIPGHWRSAVFDSMESIYQPAAALAGSAIHLLYPKRDSGGDVLVRYATCRAGCVMAANWQRSDIDTTNALFPDVAPSLAVDSGGALHAVYARLESTGWVLRYVRCAAACGTIANWVGFTADTGLDYSSPGSFAVDGSGRLHLAVVRFEPAAPQWVLRYGTCAAGCPSAGAWTFVSLDSAPSLSFPSLAIRSGTTAYLAYSVSDSDARVARCPVACTTPAGWRFDTMPGFGWGPKLGIGPTGTLHLVGRLETHLQYGRCAGACERSSDWIQAALPLPGVLSASLAVDRQDEPRVAYAALSDGLRMTLFH